MTTPLTVEQLPSTIDVRLYRGDDLSFTVVVHKGGVDLPPVPLARDVTGNGYELLITGCGYRGIVEVISATSGELLLTFPSSVTTYLGGKDRYSLVEIAPTYQRRTILGGCLEVLNNSPCTDTDESSRPGGCCGGGVGDGPILSFPSSALGVSSLNGLTGSLTSGDGGLLATLDRSGFVHPDGITIDVDGDGMLSVVGLGADGSYVLPTATSRRLGGIKVGDHLAITVDGTLSANAPPALTASAIIQALGYTPLESVGLSELVDVTLSSVIDGDVLAYSSSSQFWANQRKSSITDGGNF